MKFRFTDAPGVKGKVFRIDGDQNCHWMIFDPASGEEMHRGSDFACTPTEAEVQEWQQFAHQLAQRWKGRVAKLNETLYIRYGRTPRNGRSKNYATGMWEAGVSVYPAKYDPLTGAIVFDDEAGVWQSGTLVGVMSRIPYLVAGEYVGMGSDGEPLLRRVRRVAKLRYDEEKQGFVREA